MESQQAERRSTGIEIPERNSSRFLLLVAVSTRVVSSSPSSQPHSKPVPRSRFGNSSPPAFSRSLSNIHRVSVRGEGWANGQSVARFFFAARINPLHSLRKENLALERWRFFSRKKSRGLSLLASLGSRPRCSHPEIYILYARFRGRYRSSWQP